MEFLLPLTTATIAAISAFLLFLYHLLWIRNHAKRNISKKRAPKAAGAWPIIGHLHLLVGPELPHEILGSMADKCGPTFTINIGVHRALVVSDWKMAKECFTTNDRIFATRPKSIATELMGYNYATFGIGPYGAYWRHVRKIVMIELLSNRRLEMHLHIQVSEIESSMKEIYEFWLKNKSAKDMVKVEMKQWFGNLIMNMVVRMLSGKRYLGDEDEQRQSQKAMKEFLELLGAFVVGDAIPYLRWLDWGGQEKAMKKTAKDIDYILEGWLEEHKQKRNSGEAVKVEQQDFMDVMLSVHDGASPEDLGGFDADTVNKATCVAILSAASDTTTVTLTWALSLLLNNQDMLQKAQNEMDVHVGRERRVLESDLKNLVYLQAIIKETLRLYPPAPLSLPHESTEECVINGYTIPAGTRLLVNLWKIHRDPQVWPDPCEFRPERFLTSSHKDVDVRGKHFELIPFGSGRRICPGISLGLQVVHLTLAILLHGFDVARTSNEPIDMTESIGLTNIKATPLDVLLTPRLSAYLY